MRSKGGYAVIISRRAVLLMTLASSVGCMGMCDLFPPRRTLPGGYELERTKGPYLVVKAGKSQVDGNDPLQGQVTSLGWNDRYLLVKRRAGGSHELSGWSILDVQTGETMGSLSDAEFKEARDRNAALLEVKVLRMEDAWEELSRR